MPPLKLKLSPKPAFKTPALAPWPILVVDDDEQVHNMTELLLRDYTYDGRSFQLYSAFSASEAISFLEQAPQHIPVVLLDVVMETPDAGLRLVDHIRGKMNNRSMRIILRTGQPGEAPERDVMLNHDINDYKAKAELTSQKLFIALVAAIRSWQDLALIQDLNKSLSALNVGLEQKVMERTLELEHAKERVENALSRETEARHQLQQFLGLVSHEFRTPLAVIDSAAQMISLRAEQTDPSLLPRLNNIRSTVRHLTDIIATCLSDEQLASGRMNLSLKAADLGQLVEKSVARHHTAHPDRAIIVECPNIPLHTQCDTNLISLAIDNLLSNALKFSQDTPINVTLFSDNDNVTLKIQDHGIGISAKDLPRIFDRFFRADNASISPGTGIGLHTARQIILLHHGQILAESTLGQGTTITLKLPTKVATLASEQP